jgi:Transcription antiterminator
MPAQPLPPIDPAWYCLRVRPKQESVTARMLRTDAQIEVFCPFIRFKRPRGGSLMWVTEGMFPGYVFGKFAFSEKHRHVASISGVVSIVRFGGQPTVVDEAIIKELRDHVSGNEVVIIPQEIVPGSEVRVVAGAMRGIRAVVSRVLPARQRVAVLLEMLGIEREVEISTTDVLPDGSHPLAPR